MPVPTTGSVAEGGAHVRIVLRVAGYPITERPRSRSPPALVLRFSGIVRRGDQVTPSRSPRCLNPNRRTTLMASSRFRC